MKVDLQEIKRISIKSYLALIGCKAQKESAYYGMYLSPYRKDTQASLKVDYNQNLWHDYGTAEGGSIIDLVMKIEECSFLEAVGWLRNNKKIKKSFSFHRNTLLAENRTKIDKAKKLENKALLEYLRERKINQEIAQRYCEEIYYQVRGKLYFGIAFENNSKGYEVRSKYFKGCIGKKDITCLKYGSNVLNVFEGFIDFLSALTLNKNKSVLSFDAIILNSLVNIKYAKGEFKKYQSVNLFLDNDESGQNLTKNLLKEFSNVKDYSHTYAGYKDINDFLTKRMDFPFK